MNTKRTIATDIAEISTALDGMVEFSNIQFDQILICEHGQSVNDLLFIEKKFGIFFYTSRSGFDGLCYLKTKILPTYVVSSGSKNVYRIS